MDTNFNKQSILFQNSFYVLEDKKKFTFEIPNLKQIYGNENELEFLLSILRQPVDKVSAIFFPNEVRVFNTIADLIVYAGKKGILKELDELLDAMNQYANIYIEDGELFNNENKITVNAINKIFKSISQSLTSDFEETKEESTEFIPPDVSNIPDEFMKQMVIREAESAWKLEQARKAKAERGDSGVTTDGIFAAVMEAFKLSAKEISEFSLYTLYWHYSLVYAIDNQKVLRVAQGNGLLDGKKNKYEFIIDKKGE